MFKKAQGLDSAFRHVRTFTIVVVLVSLAICCFSLYESFEYAYSVQKKVYVLAGGKALAAVQADRNDNIPIEARDHVRTFHEDFFSLDPDEKVIRSNVTKALYLADGSVKRLYDNLVEKGFYSDVISGNISQRIHVDSVNVYTLVYPYQFICYATETITRETNITTRRLKTKGYLRGVTRSDNNPHGFLIERFEILENGDIKTENR